MSEEVKKGNGWLKGILGTLAGLLSGAAAMYVSPLVDRVIKPPRPLANFAVETEGLTATFHNRFAGEGWWDFGDGSPLEPATVEQASVTHTFPKPGTFTTKLTVRNYVGEEHERTVSVDVTTGASNSPAPAIASLEAVQVGPSRAAPATFRLSAQMVNTERCLWDTGGDRPVEVVAGASAKQERFVTFATPGVHSIELVALNGNQAVKRAVSVQVDPPSAGTLIARLHVMDRGARMDKRQTTEMVPLNLTRSSRSGHTVDRKIDARTGFTITEAKLGAVDPSLQNLKVTVAAGGKMVQVTGKFVPPAAMLEAPNPPMVPVLVTQERQLKTVTPPAEVTSAIALPGSTILPLPAPPVDCEQPQRSLVLELRGAAGQIWQQPLPANSVMDWQGRRYTIRATPVGNDVRLDVLLGGAGLTSRDK